MYADILGRFSLQSHDLFTLSCCVVGKSSPRKDLSTGLTRTPCCDLADWLKGSDLSRHTTERGHSRTVAAIVVFVNTRSCRDRSVSRTDCSTGDGTSRRRLQPRIVSLLFLIFPFLSFPSLHLFVLLYYLPTGTGLHGTLWIDSTLFAFTKCRVARGHCKDRHINWTRIPV